MRRSWRVAGRVGAVVLGLAAALLAGAPAHAVTNGSPVLKPVSSVPWVLSLEYAASAGVEPASICTASAVSPVEIVTASHCVKGRGFLYVRVGANTLSGGSLVPIEAIRDNASYNSNTFANDIAVLRPVVPLRLSRYARLGTAAMENRIRSTRPPALTLYGWGIDQGGRQSGRLNAATVRPQITEARALYGKAFNPRLTVAAGYYNSRRGRYVGACNGDSGGPLVTRQGNVAYLVGVVSFGKSGCTSQAPTVFTAVGNFTAWLTVARRLLPRLAVTANRALPFALTSPVITGTPGLGATLTCSQGTWSANAKTFTWQWYRSGASSGQRAPIGTGPTRVVEAADAGRGVFCVVAARSRRGTTYEIASMAVPASPEPYVSPRVVTVAGLPTDRRPVEGETATCAVPAFTEPDVTTSYAWYASGSPTDLTGATALAPISPAFLVMTSEVLTATAGRYLVCQATSSNAMGTAVGVGAHFVPVG